MAVAIVATVGSGSANSFVTLAEFTSYMEGRLNSSAFDNAASDDLRNRALVEATRELNNRAWQGRRVDTTQSLNWPRQWVIDPDDPNRSYFATDVVPQRVKDACCELAFQFLKAGTTDVAALDATHGVRSKTIDVLSTEYEPHMRKQGLARYPRVMDFIRPLLEGAGIIVPVVRG